MLSKDNFTVLYGYHILFFGAFGSCRAGMVFGTPDLSNNYIYFHDKK